MNVTLPKLLELDASFAYTALMHGGFVPVLLEYEGGSEYRLICTTLASSPEKIGVMGCNVVLDEEMRPRTADYVQRLWVRVWRKAQKEQLVGYCSPYHGHPEKTPEMVRRAVQSHGRPGFRRIEFSPPADGAQP